MKVVVSILLLFVIAIMVAIFCLWIWILLYTVGENQYPDITDL